MRQRLAALRPNGDRIALALALAVSALAALASSTLVSLPAYVAGAVGLAAVHERLRPEFGRRVSLVATLLLLGATSLFWHMTRAADLAEAAMFALVASLLYLARQRAFTRPLAWFLALLAPIVQQALQPAAVHEAASSAWLADLFSSSHGLLSLTPVAYVAFGGAVLYIRRNPGETLTALAVFAAWLGMRTLLSVDADPADPFAHRLTAALALFAPGLAFVIEIARRRPILAIAPLVLLGLTWNYWLMVQYTIGTLPKDAPVSFARMVQQQADVLTRSPFIYPFAFPANAWFALRENVPAARYDVLAREPRHRSLDLVMDRRADRFLLEGWDAPGQEPQGPVHWLGFARATIALPLDPPPQRPVRVTIVARARLDDPPVNADLGVELNGHVVGRMAVSPVAPGEAHMTIPATAVGRILRAGYNRLTFVSYGVHARDATAAPAATAARPRDRAWPVAIYRIRIAPE